MRAKLTSFLSILCLLMVFAAVVQAAPAGKVTNLEGRADLTAPGQPAKALLIGDTVNVGDILRTKSGSKLEVTWIDGSIARLSENSRLKVTEFTLGVKKRSTILSLFRGKVQNVVTGATQLFGEKDGSRYEIHTPTSVCGVRGTVFFIYHENGVSGALFTEGKGFMYSKGQPGNVKPVAPGVMMIVTSANKPPEAKPAKPGDATKLFNATNPSEKKKDDKKGEEKKEGATGGGTSGTGGTTAASGKDESTGTTKTEDTGGTAGTTGTTGAGDTGSGTTGTGGTTTMLGGDPTASTPPATVTGSVAGNILTGSTAGTTGIAGTTGTTTTQTTNPVTPVVVPVIEPTPTGTTTTFTQDVTQGTISGKLTGSISDKTNTGTLNLAGTGMESIYVVPTTGTLSDGSTDNAYLAGIPGSWRGLFIGLSRKGTSVSLLSGSFPSGAYTDQTLNAAGSIARTVGSSIGAESQYQAFTDLPLLVLQNVSIGEAFDDPVIYGPTSGDVTTDGIMGYNTSAGGILGIWGAQTLNGAYINATGETSKNINLYHYSYYWDPGDHFAFGSAVITDDLLGHTTVKSSSLTYLDRYYLGTLSLDYQGVYAFAPETSPTVGVSYPYSSIGTGIYNLQPLSWSGDWGSNRYYYYPAYYYANSLYGNFYDEESRESFMELAAHETGLAGGVTPFWSQTSRMTAMGYVEDGDGYPVMGETVAGPLLWNSGIAAQALTGAIVEDIFTADAEFTGITAGVWNGGLMKGSAYAIYKTAAGQAGWLIGNAVSGTYDSEIGMWKAEGDLTPTPKFAALYPELTADLEVFHDIAFGITGGSFGGQGSILNQFSILQTTFYGKRILVYDEEYEQEVERILPLRWGIYDVMTGSGNSFTGKTPGASSWTAKVGGVGPTQMGAPFYYLADITGTWAADETISGQLSGRYMTPLYMGVLSGPFYGLYNVGGTDESGQFGGWIGQSVGTYNVTQKLAHSASWGGGSIFGYYADEGVLLTDSSGQMYEVGYAAGILGGTTTPWSSSTAISAMGLFSVYDNTEYKRASYLWNAALAGSVPKEINETPTAGGIYAGYSAALWRADNFTGAIRTLYLTPPDATTGKSTAGFLTGSIAAGSVYPLNQGIQYNEYEEAEYSYAVGLWESTGALTPLAPIVNGLDPASITSSYGEMDGKLSGSFAGTGILSNDAYSGDLMFFMNSSTPLPFGVYDLKLGYGGGTFSGKPAGASSWNGNLGGYLSLYNNVDQSYDSGYWIAGASGQWSADGEITGNVANGKYLTTMQSGILSGPFYGLYTEQGTGESGTYGTWVGQSVGNYEGKNLAFVSDIYPSLRYWDGSAWQYASLSISGLLGGTDSLWDSSVSAPVSISALGSLYLYGTPNSNGNIFSASTASHNYKDIAQVNTTYDGGAYYLFYGGRERSETLEANIAGLYIYDGKAGFLRGNLDGDVFSQIGVWEASGSIYKEEKDTTGILAENLQDNLWWGGLTGNISSEGGSLSGAVGFNYGATLYDKNGGTNWIMNGGIWQADLGGSYRGTIETPWTARVGGQGVFGPYFDGGGFAPDSGYWLAGITGGMWSDDNLSADVTGSYITSVNLGTMSGKLLGTYDANYWQAAAVGTHEGTPLAYSTQVYLGHWGYYNTTPGSEGLVHDVYSIAGLTGGFNSLFSGEADVTGMGTYTRNENSPLFAMLLVNANGGPETNPFHIYYGGSRVPAYEDYPEWFEGKMAGFYARNWDGAKYNEIGLLTSGPLMIDGEPSGLSVWGDVYPEIGMWEIPVDEGQGTLMHTAKTGTVSSLSIEESDWSPAAKVEGDFQGTMRMKSAHIAGIEDWGAWIAAAGGPSPAEISEDGTWTSTTGWKETNTSGKASYSIASVDGYTYGDGGFWAGVSGRFLNPDNMGIFTGDLVGILGNDTWQAMGVGSFEAFPLAYNGAFLEDNGGFGYWDFVNKKFVTEDSSTPPLPLAKIGGLVGGVGELFNGQGPGGANLPVDLTGIGEYAAAKVDTYSLFGSEIAGDNDLVASATNNYLLKFGGVRKANGAGGSLLGKGLGLYYRQTAADVYEVGLLSSNLIQATLYPAIGDPANPGMWEIPEDGGSTLLASAKNTVQGSADPPIPNPVHDGLKRPGAIGTAEQKLGDISLESAGYLNQNWGILYGGFGLDQGALPVGSTAIAGGTMIYEGGAEPVTIGYWMGNISNIETLDSYTTGTYVGETIFFDAQNRVFQKGVVNTDPSALGANLVAVNDGNKQVGMTLADYATTPMAFGSMINGSVQQIVNGTLYEKEYEQPYFDGYFRPLGYEYRYFPYPSATANATNGIAFETIEKQMVGSQGTYDDRYHYLYTGNYVGTTSIHYINHLFIGGPTSALDPVPNFTGSSPVSPHFDSSLIVDGTTWFTADKYVKTLSTQWDNVNALVRNVPFQGILGGLPGENLWTATGSDPAQIKLIGTVDPSAQYMTFSGNITGTTDSVSATPTNAYFASIGGTLLGSAGGITPLSGAVIGLFINQDNPSAPKAGFLHGSFSGDAYAGIGMWDGTGGLWVEEKTITGALPEAGAAGLLTPEHPSLFTGVLGVDVNDNLAGSFLDDQNASSGLIQSQIVTLGSTYSIAGQTDWGIFTMTHAMNNTYSNPEGKTAWTSDFAGVAEFGGYLSHDTHWTYRDAGYWKASITDGTWANGWIGGDVAGEFLTHKKYGTLTGQLQGVYTPDTVGGTTGTWQDVIGGAWQKAGDVYFSSAVYGRAYTLRHSQQGGAVYDQGGGINNYYSFYYEDDHAIWPDQYADATYTNNGNQTKTTYRFEMYGMPTSPVYRKNTWTQNMSDGTYTFAQTVYETRDEYLSAMADLANGPEGAVTPYGYYVLGDNSGFYGLMAGVGNLWDNLGSTTATPLRFAGDIDQFDTAERGFSLFAAQVVSFDPLTTLDPFMNSRTPVWNGKSGAYLANLGGIVDNQQNLTGSLQGLYLDDSGNVGIFYGNLTGRHDTALSMWGAEGSAYTYQMNTFSEITGLGLTPENFAGALIIETNMNGIPDPGLAGENVIGVTGSAIHLSSLQSTKIKLPSAYGGFDPNWRVEQTLLGGTYAGKPSSWTWTFNSPTAGPLLPEDTDWGSVQITPSDTTNAFTGQMAGAKVKWAEGVTKVNGAEIKGLFDPVATTWKAVAQGAEMETGAFLAKVSSLDDAGKKAFMDATKIPAVQVGQATLSQASGTTVNNLSNVAMNNVGFYAYSTGAAPKIWATNNVSGSYSGTPSTSGLPANNVPLSGGGLNANFNVNQWNGSTWSATVAGSGALSSGSYNQPIQFTGGAAGAIQPATGSTGSFSGTGAGIAK